MWLEIGANEIRILNDKYEEVARHKRKHKRAKEPIIAFENYVSELIRKPRAFIASPYFSTLPEAVQKHLKSLTYPELKKTLLFMLPIFEEDKIGDAAAVLELSTIRDADEFAAAYRALTEDPRALPTVTTPTTPAQKPYIPKFDQYGALMGVKTP
jgi:hypothetical protein